MWDLSGKNTGVGGHFLFQGIFPTQGSNSSLLRWQADSLWLSHQGSPPLTPHPTVPFPIAILLLCFYIDPVVALANTCGLVYAGTINTDVFKLTLKLSNTWTTGNFHCSQEPPSLFTVEGVFCKLRNGQSAGGRLSPGGCCFAVSGDWFRLWNQIVPRNKKHLSCRAIVPHIWKEQEAPGTAYQQLLQLATQITRV